MVSRQGVPMLMVDMLVLKKLDFYFFTLSRIKQEENK